MKTSVKLKSVILVSLQVVCMLFLLVKIPFLQLDLWAIVVAFLGFLLSLWAITTMKLDNFNGLPDVKENAHLVTSGPYKVIRHPIYCSILLLFTPLVIDKPSAFLIIISVVQLITLVVKLNYEEKLLRNHFEEYSSYSKHTWKLIPFIY